MSWRTIVKEKNIEAVEIYFSNLFGSLRLDAECYQQKYLGIDLLLSRKTTRPLIDFTKVTDGDHSKFPESQKDEVRYLRSKDIKKYFLVDDDPVFVSTEYFNKQKRSHIFGENILISIMGNVGDITITPKKFDVCIANRAVCILKDIKINPYFLFAYLISDVANLNIERLKTGGVQERINLEILQTLPIPVSQEDELNKAIEALVINAHKTNESSKESLLEAEQMLLKEINLEGYKGTNEAISVRNFSEALADNRFDAEYWQPDYNVIQNAIKKHKDGYDTLDNLFDILDKKMTIDPERAYLYVELADVNGAMGTIDNFTELQGKELPSRGRMSLKKNDIVMSSLDGSLNKIALVTSDAKNIIGSTGFFVLRQKEYEPEVALMLLKSRPIRTLLERQGQGTILSAIPKHSLSRVVLPKLNQTTKNKIKELVLSAHSQKEEAKELLEKAKRAVEVFVERDEEAALAFLSA